ELAQTVEFVGALERRADQELPRLRMVADVNERATRRHHRRVQRRTRSVRRDERQSQNQNGEKYAAHWENTKNRQHCQCITESGTFPKPGSRTRARRARV